MKTVEVLDEEIKEDMEPLSPVIGDVLGDQPLVKPDIVVLTNKTLEIRNAKVEEKKLAAENDGLLVVVANVLSRGQVVSCNFEDIVFSSFNFCIKSDRNFVQIKPKKNLLKRKRT